MWFAETYANARSDAVLEAASTYLSLPNNSTSSFNLSLTFILSQGALEKTEQTRQYRGFSALESPLPFQSGSCLGKPPGRYQVTGATPAESPFDHLSWSCDGPVSYAQPWSGGLSCMIRH